MKPSDVSYWSAMAQILPVFGIGMVIEFRVLTTQSAYRESPVYRLIQGIAWFGVALVLALSTVVALAALETDRTPSDLESAVAQFAVAAAAASLIVSPLLSAVLTSNADVPARVFAMSPRRLLYRFSVRRSFRRAFRKVLILRHETAAWLGKWEAVLEEEYRQRRRIEAFPRPWTQEVQELHDQAMKLIASAETDTEQARRMFRGAVRTEVNVSVWANYAFRVLAEAHGRVARNDAKYIADSIALGAPGASGRAVQLPLDLQPDDGGFLHPVPVAGVPAFPDLDFIITDPDFFETYVSEDGEDLAYY